MEYIVNLIKKQRASTKIFYLTILADFTLLLMWMTIDSYSGILVGTEFNIGKMVVFRTFSVGLWLVFFQYASDAIDEMGGYSGNVWQQLMQESVYQKLILFSYITCVSGKHIEILYHIIFL